MSPFLSILLFNLSLLLPLSLSLNITESHKLSPADGDLGDYFGFSVSLSTDGLYALVGSYRDDDAGSDSGSASVFVLSNSGWARQAKLVASDADLSDSFGYSVAISGDASYALIGAIGEGSFEKSGSAYVFSRSGTTWTEQQKLTASDPAEFDEFGNAVALSEDGSRALVAAAKDDDSFNGSGSVYVFLRTGTTWAQEQKLVASDAVAGAFFGYSLSLSLDASYALIGAAEDDDDGESSGAAYVFLRTGTTWTQQQKLNPLDASANDRFGCSASLSHDASYALIGAYGDDDVFSNTGSAYVFTRSGALWSEQAKLNTQEASQFDYFGSSVALNGDGSYAVIGAPLDDDRGLDSGASYAFLREGTTWTEQTKIVASDSSEGRRFGTSVAVTSNSSFALIGAYFDDSGSAYMIDLICPPEYYCPTGQLVSAVLCSLGNYCPLGSTDEIPCSLEGSYCPEGSSSQELCPAGYYCPTPSDVIPCSLTTYCPVGSTEEGVCSPGFYCPTPSQIFPCTAGHYCPGSTSEEIDCSLGTLCPDGSSRELSCPASFYCPSPAGTVECSIGHYCPTNSSAERECIIRTYCPAGSANPRPCPAGGYCPSPSENLLCSAGFYCPESSRAPIECSLGTYCPFGVDRERACAAGYVCPTPSTQNLCSALYFCPEGSTSETRCSDGSYCPAGSATEETCSAGNYCENPGKIRTCSSGHYCPPGSVDETPCTLHELCPSGTSDPTPCPAGTRRRSASSQSCNEACGTQCFGLECTDSQYQDHNECRECYYAWLALVCFFVMSILLYALYQNTGENPFDLVMIRLSAGVVQAGLLAAVLRVSTPEIFSWLTSVLSFLRGEVIVYSLPCASPSTDLYTKYFVLLVLLLFIVIILYLMDIRAKSKLGVQPPPEEEVEEFALYSKRLGHRIALNRFIALFLSTCYPALVTASLTLWPCEGDTLAYDSTLDCESSTQSMMQLLSVIVLSLVGLAGPLTVIGGFHSSGYRRTEVTTEVISWRVYMAEPFSDSYPWFEAILMLRKGTMLLVLISSSSVFLPCMIAAGINLIFGLLVWRMQPYRFVGVANTIECMCSVVLSIIFILVGISSSSRGAILVALLFAYLILFLGSVLSIAARREPYLPQQEGDDSMVGMDGGGATGVVNRNEGGKMVADRQDSRRSRKSSSSVRA